MDEGFGGIVVLCFAAVVDLIRIEAAFDLTSNEAVARSVSGQGARRKRSRQPSQAAIGSRVAARRRGPFRQRPRSPCRGFGRTLTAQLPGRTEICFLLLLGKETDPLRHRQKSVGFRVSV